MPVGSVGGVKRPRWRPVEHNDRHLRSHRKIGDCEQSSESMVRGNPAMDEHSIQ